VTNIGYGVKVFLPISLLALLWKTLVRYPVREEREERERGRARRGRGILFLPSLPCLL